VFRKAALSQVLPELVVQRGVLRIRAQRAEIAQDRRVERIVRIQKLRVEERALVRIAVAVRGVRLHGGASCDEERGGCDDEGFFHHESCSGFAFSFTFPSTVSTRKATEFTLYRDRTISLCFCTICPSCSIVIVGSLPSLRCSL